MAAADYRLMTEATGQRIAAALEALSGTGAAAAAARANLDVYSTGETDELIAQSTAKTVDSGVLATYTYGTLRYRLLTNFGVAQIIWSGNANIPDENTVNVTLPDKLKPTYNSYAVMRNGDMMEVRNETTAGVLRLTFGSAPKSWSSASITYIP